MRRLTGCIAFLFLLGLVIAVPSCKKDDMKDRALRDRIVGTWALVKTEVYEEGSLESSEGLSPEDYNDMKEYDDAAEFYEDYCDIVVTFKSNGTCLLDEDKGEWSIDLKVLYLYPPDNLNIFLDDDDLLDFWFGDCMTSTYKIIKLNDKEMVLKHCFAMFPSDWEDAEDYTMKYFKRI